MKIGDLVKFEPDEKALVINDTVDQRRVGTVLGFDVYRGNEKAMGVPLRNPEAIIEVLWNTGKVGWILQNRVEVASENR
tara:strand:- start:5554 stop:5790 length:237 start_codon:yes stop_codon:yes gene_type:complete